MKKMKLAVVFAALVSVFGFSSCLNSDDNGNGGWDYADYVTVVQGYLGNTVLKTDGGLTLTPLNSSILSVLSDGKGGYYTRGTIFFKLAEGEVIEEGKTSYNISAIPYGGPMLYKGFNIASDTLKADYSITSFETKDINTGALITRVWAKNGYVNVPFTTKINTNSITKDAFHLYATDVKEDTLYTRFRQDAGSGDNANQTTGGLISFGIPFNDYEFEELYRQLTPKEDSIVIKIIANGENGETLSKTTKYKMNER